MSSGENRLHPRLTIQHTGIQNVFLVGRVMNLSLGGLGLESTTGLRIGSQHSFRVSVGSKPFKVDGEVRWCRLTQTVSKGRGDVVAIYRAGLAFNQPLKLFSERGLQNNGEWFDPEVRMAR